MSTLRPKRTLLIVDDSWVQREHTSRLAHVLGFDEVHQACHGADALLRLDQMAQAGQRPDAIVIDLEMPVMDGVQLIQELCIRDPDIPFVVASTREASLIDAVDTMARAFGRPAAATLCKPFGVDALRAALAHCTQVEPPTGRAGQAVAATPTTIEAGLLAQAIETGQVVPYYQPKVDVRTALLRGVEVLARWTDPVLGVVPPDCFIVAAERSGLIHALTMSVLDQALAQASFWRSRGLAPTIAVNLSPLLLGRADLVDEIGATLARHGLRPAQVVLELTEGSVIAQQGAALATLARLRLQGYGLSIDDYGTGFSSMQQLSRIPFTELKIDRSFVNGAHRHEHVRVILQSAVEMASRLSITSVAEGVESLDDWRLLQQMGCELAQGWLIGKAMPADDVADWIRRHALRLPSLCVQSASADASPESDATTAELHRCIGPPLPH